MSLQKYASAFDVEPGFCNNCGTIITLAADTNSIKCGLCHTTYGAEAYGLMESHYVLHFHTPEEYMANMKASEEGAEGPIVERKCPKCGNDKMTYSTLQLRSADEGQTVFYKCTKCKFSEAENS